VGPALPPHLLRQRQEEGKEEEQKTVAGEDDRKVEEVKEEAEEEAPSVMVFGAALPPHLLEERRKREEEEEKQKQEAAAAPPRRRVCGPSLDDLVAAPEEPKDEDEDEKEVVEVLGPLRPDGMELPSSLVPPATRIIKIIITCVVHESSHAFGGVMNEQAQIRELVSRNPSEQRCRRHPPTPSTRKSESSVPSATSSKGATRRASLPTRCLLPPHCNLLSRSCWSSTYGAFHALLTPDVACPCLHVVTACRSKRQRRSPKWARTRSWRTTCSFTTYAPFVSLSLTSSPSSPSAHPGSSQNCRRSIVRSLSWHSTPRVSTKRSSRRYRAAHFISALLL
jgi:hypothetical protein